MKHNIQTKRIGNKKGNTPLSLETRRSIRKKHRSWEKYRCKQDSESYKEYTKARNKAKSIITVKNKKLKQQNQTVNTFGRMLIVREKQNLESQNYILNEMELKLLLQTMGKRLRYWLIFSAVYLQ